MKTIGFIGLGLIGGSVARTIRKFHPDYHLLAFDTDREALAEAVSSNIIDGVCDIEDERFRSCNYIFLCAPVEFNVEYMEKMKDSLGEHCILTDVGSVKSIIHEKVTELGLDSRFIGGHPMAGSERSGFSNSSDHLLENAAGGFRDITRIASSSPIMWEQICLENQKNISTVLDEFIRMLIQIRCSIDNKESDNIFDMFASSKDYRDSIDILDNSLIPRSYVLYIDVADEAGAIATIATILATEKVSIKNIGIIHNREFEDGVLKIEFYTDQALEQAKVLLNKRNYKICER